MAEKRNNTVRFRVRDDELALIDEAVARADVSRSAFLRRAALDAAVPVVHADHIEAQPSPARSPDNSFRRADAGEADHNEAPAAPQRRRLWRLPVLRRLRAPAA